MQMCSCWGKYKETETPRSKRGGNDGKIRVRNNSEYSEKLRDAQRQEYKGKVAIKIYLSLMHSYVWAVVDTDVGAK